MSVPGGQAARIEVRSFRRVFELERRVYRIDRLRLNPAGVPVRGGVYFLALAVSLSLLRALPLLGTLVGWMPWYVRYLALPGCLAALFATVRIDARPFHVAVRAILARGLRPRRLRLFEPAAREGTRWWPHDVVILPDGSEPRMRAMTYRGPGAVLVLGRAEISSAPTRWPWGAQDRRLVLRECSGGQRSGRPRVVMLKAGARLRVRPASARGSGSGRGGST